MEAAPAPAAAQTDPQLLPGHHLERALLLLQQLSSPSKDAPASLTATLSSLLQGDVSAALQSPAGMQLVLSPRAADGASPMEVYLGIASELAVQQERQLSAILVGAAALLAFMQCNWTGPDLPEALRLELDRSNGDRKAAISHLEVDGETIYTEVLYPQLLVAALRIFSSPNQFNRCTVRLWARLSVSLTSSCSHTRGGRRAQR